MARQRRFKFNSRQRPRTRTRTARSSFTSPENGTREQGRSGEEASAGARSPGSLDFWRVAGFLCLTHWSEIFPAAFRLAAMLSRQKDSYRRGCHEETEISRLAEQCRKR